MKIISLLLLLYPLHWISCTSTQVMLQEEASYSELTEKLDGETVRISIYDEQEFSGEQINIGPDTTRWIQKKSDQAAGINIYTDGYTIIKNWSIPTSEVNTVSTPYFGSHILDGMLIGGITGGAIGLIFSISQMDERSWTGKEWGASTLIITVPAGFAAGAILGIPAGAAVKHTDKYIINTQADPSLNKRYITLKNPILRLEKENVMVRWQGKNIILNKSEVKLIATRYNEYFLTIPFDVYEANFK